MSSSAAARLHASSPAARSLSLAGTQPVSCYARRRLRGHPHLPNTVCNGARIPNRTSPSIALSVASPLRAGHRSAAGRHVPALEDDSRYRRARFQSARHPRLPSRANYISRAHHRVQFEISVGSLVRACLSDFQRATRRPSDLPAERAVARLGAPPERARVPACGQDAAQVPSPD